jgi:hypothetical protein
MPLKPAQIIDKYQKKLTGTPSTRLRRSFSGCAQTLICEPEIYLTDFCASQ